MNRKRKQLGCVGVASSRSAYCDLHNRGEASREEVLYTPSRSRPEYHTLYNTSAWRRLRKSVLAASPLCVRCTQHGLVVRATDVDHVIAHKGDRGLFYARSNLQTLCKSCHSWKTNRSKHTPVSYTHLTLPTICSV